MTTPPPDFRAASPESKHRLVQLYASAAVLWDAFDREPYLALVKSRDAAEAVIDRLPIALYFNDHAAAVLSAFGRLGVLMASRQVTAEDPPLCELFNRPRPFPLLAEDKLQEVLWSQRELISATGVPQEPDAGELTKVGLMFTHAISAVFGFISEEYGKPQRQLIARCA
ncbi:MAG: hypothetical protein ACOYEV_06315 [Candidatus Nanopelagicales bacterium]